YAARATIESNWWLCRRRVSDLDAGGDVGSRMELCSSCARLVCADRNALWLLDLQTGETVCEWRVGEEVQCLAVDASAEARAATVEWGENQRPVVNVWAISGSKQERCGSFRGETRWRAFELSLRGEHALLLCDRDSMDESAGCSTDRET